MPGERYYIEKVDKLLELLHQRCLGQDTYLCSVLPKDIRQRDAKTQAEYLAAQICFSLMSVSCRYHDAKEQARIRQWLEAVIGYLLEKTPIEDQTFAQLIRLTNCKQTLRNLLFDQYLPEGHEVRTGEPPPTIEKLDETVWHLLGARKKQSAAREFYRTLRETVELRGIPDL